MQSQTGRNYRELHSRTMRCPDYSKYGHGAQANLQHPPEMLPAIIAKWRFRRERSGRIELPAPAIGKVPAGGSRSGDRALACALAYVRGRPARDIGLLAVRPQIGCSLEHVAACDGRFPQEYHRPYRPMLSDESVAAHQPPTGLAPGHR